MADRIEIMKETLTPQYGRFRQFKAAPRPPVRNRQEHGSKLMAELKGAVAEINEQRKAHGINTANLMVLELVSDALPPASLEHLERYNLWIVEETRIPDTNKSKLVIQFENKDALSAFAAERRLYTQGSDEQGTLAQGQRDVLFSCIENIRKVERIDRIGPRLKNHLANNGKHPEGFFVVNIDVWHNEEQHTIPEIESQIKGVLGTTGSKLRGDLFAVQTLLLGRASVNEFTLNALLDCDLIASVDLPMDDFAQDYTVIYPQSLKPVVINELDDNAPLATVIDSGVFTGNPLLSGIIVGEEDFDLTENTPSDLHGHGTGVAGIVAYGEFPRNHSDNHVFKPLVRICNGKVMHKDEGGNVAYSTDKRPEEIVRDAIVHFNEHYHCRVFNLSSGSAYSVYEGGRQLSWAAMLDELIRTLDIVIVVSAGNQSEPELPEFIDRDDLHDKVRNQLLNSAHRLIDPATSALSITVGSIARYANPLDMDNRITAIAAGDTDTMSAFTRTGKGVNNAVKPEFVDYGGNYAVHQMSRGDSRWKLNDLNLSEPTTNHTTEKVFRGFHGTSFSAPRVTHYAARLERSLESQLQEAPTGNLIRAMLASAASYPGNLQTWAEEAVDAKQKGSNSQKQDKRLRLVGYGKVNEDVLFSSTDDPKHVTLFAEDELSLRSLHLYKIPVPADFLNIKAAKRITIGFAYNPPLRISRKEYISNRLLVNVFRRVDMDKLLSFVQKQEKPTDQTDEEKDAAKAAADALLEEFRTKYSIKSLRPGSGTIHNSTLQQFVWYGSPRGGKDLLWDDNDPYIYVLVTGKELFTHSDKELPQQYAIAITFSYDSPKDILLHQQIANNVRMRNRIEERIRERERVQGQL